MTHRRRVPDEAELASRLLAAAATADLACSDLQAASWPTPSPGYQSIAHLGHACAYLTRAANTVEPVPLGYTHAELTVGGVAAVFSAAGAVVVTATVAAWSPPPVAGYAVGASLACWWISLELLQRVRNWRAMAGLRARTDMRINDPLVLLRGLVGEISSLLTITRPELSQRRREADADIHAAAAEASQAIRAWPKDTAS